MVSAWGQRGIQNRCMSDSGVSFDRVAEVVASIRAENQAFLDECAARVKLVRQHAGGLVGAEAVVVERFYQVVEGMAALTTALADNAAEILVNEAMAAADADKTDEN